jgi:uncharacterized coiled-coil protein SlyX
MDRLRAATKFLVKIEDKVERLSDTVKFQQQKIEALNERLLRLEMLVQFGPQRDHVRGYLLRYWQHRTARV